MVNVSKARINHINNIFILLFLTIHGKFGGRLIIALLTLLSIKS
jgi:hypothetical protein